MDTATRGIGKHPGAIRIQAGPGFFPGVESLMHAPGRAGDKVLATAVHKTDPRLLATMNAQVIRSCRRQGEAAVAALIGADEAFLSRVNQKVCFQTRLEKEGPGTT